MEEFPGPGIEGSMVDEGVERASEGDLEADLGSVTDTTWYSDAVWSVSSLKESAGYKVNFHLVRILQS